MATVQQQTTQLEFHQAMADFKTMFPDMDDEVIEVKTPTSHILRNF
jgi:CUE domain.